MCEFCEGRSYKTLIESDKKVNCSFDYDEEIKFSEAIDEDNSVIFEIRNGNGFIRLVNREDCNCIESGGYFKINYCPMCGRKLESED